MLSRSREHHCTDPAAFEEGVRRLVAKARPVTRFGLPLPGAFALSKLRIGEVLLEVTSLVRTHRVKVTSLVRPNAAECNQMQPTADQPATSLAAAQRRTRPLTLSRWSPTSPTS